MVKKLRPEGPETRLQQNALISSLLGETSLAEFGSCCAFLDDQTSPVNVMKLMVVALAGWINQQQEDVIDQRTGSSSRSSDQRWKGRGTAASGLEDCFATTTETPHEIDDSSF